MKRIHLILLCFLAFCTCVQNSLKAQVLGEWKVYPSYQIATQNVVAGKSVYSLMDGNLLRYDTEDGSVELYDCLNGLSDVHINHLAYCDEAKRLVLVYDNGNIDLLDLDGNVLNIAALKEKPLGGKMVSSVSVYGKNAYLTTGFGYLKLDVKEAIILDTYRFGIDVQAVVEHGDDIWMSGNNGVYCTPMTNPDLHNLSTWKCRHSAVNWSKMVVLGDDVYVLHKGGVYRFTSNSASQFKAGSFTSLKVLSDGKMYFGNASQMFIYSSATEGQSISFNNDWKDFSMGSSNIYWVSEGGNGLRTYKLTDGEFVQGNEVIQPNSPRRDLFYRMHYDTNAQGEYRLLVAGGINTYLPVFNPATAMMLENGKWTYFDEVTPVEQYPDLRHYNTSDIVQDPNDPTHHFASPYRTGLYEYRDGKFVGLYNCDNSPLRSILPDIPQYKNYVSATCLEYDASGNLWMCNQETDTIIRVLTPKKKWVALGYNEIAREQQCDGYLFSSSGVNFLVCRRMDSRGFFGFDTKGTLSNIKDDSHKLRSTIVNQDGTSYTPSDFQCMTEDMDGHIWCGTNVGLFVIDDPATFFDNDFAFTQIKLARNDGSGLADYLLNGVSIRCVAIDGGNRKWIGTENDGVYLISADCSEMVHHFLASETPLLSDNIQSIAIHPKTGEVMIGTDRGLCSFMADATEAEEDLDENNVIAYPNPVRPDYTGPIRIDGLSFDAEVKICSVTGQLIWSGRSTGGTCTWNGCNKQGKRVASGVYNVIANTADGNKAIVCRIIVIK